MYYGKGVSRLPKILRLNIDTVTINAGNVPWGGGNRDILIHTGSSEFYKNFWEGDIIEETLVHEAAHTSLDPRIYNTEAWHAAVAEDGKYISDYAREFPRREDVAETFVVWLATRCSKDTMTTEKLAEWEGHMGARFAYFDEMAFTGDMLSPWTSCSPP